MKKILLAVFLFPIIQVTAFADSVTGTEKIKNVIGYCGKMPAPMIAGFIVLAILAVITVIILKNKGASDK